MNGQHCREFAAPRKGWVLNCHRTPGHEGLHYDLVQDADWGRTHALDACSLNRLERGNPLPPAIHVIFRIPTTPEQEELW